MESDGRGSADNRWPILVVLFLARTAIAFQFQSVAALGPVLVEQVEMDYASLGALVGLFMLPGRSYLFLEGYSASALATRESLAGGWL